MSGTNIKTVMGPPGPYEICKLQPKTDLVVPAVKEIRQGAQTHDQTQYVLGHRLARRFVRLLAMARAPSCSQGCERGLSVAG